jgi:rsbT co-antagonist protein RsbR
MTPGETLQSENEWLKQRVAELEGELEQTRRIVEKMPQLVFVFDLVEQRNIYTNREVAETPGYSPEAIQAMGDNILPQIIHPDDMANVLPAHFDRLAQAQDDEVLTVEYRFRNSQGDWRWVSGQDIVFARAEDGSVRQSLGVVQDITERKQAEAQMQLFHFSLENASDGIHWLDPQGQHVYVNEALCQNLGYTREELLGMGVPDIDPNFPKEAFHVAWEQVKQQDRTFETIHRRKDGSLMPVEVKAKYLEYNGQEYLCSFLRDITERKQMEENLHRFRLLVENAADGIGVASLDGIITYVNPAYQRMMGYDDTLVGTNILDVYNEPAEKMLHLVQHVREHGSWQGELSYRRKDGTIFPGVMSAFAIYNEQGEVQNVAGIIRDVTERKQIETHLYESQQQLQFILEGSGDGAWDWHMGANTAVLSERYREMLGGYTLEELPNQVESWLNLMHPEDQPEVNQRLQEYLAGHTTIYAVEHRLKHKRGEWRWTLSRGKVIERDAEGTPLRMTGTLSDIHERKQQEESLRAFQSLIEASPDGIGIATMDGITTYANPALQSLTGYGEALIGKSFIELYPQEYQAAVASSAQEVATQGYWQGNLMLQRPDGEQVPVQLSSFIIRNKQGQPIRMTGMFRDLTEQQRAEAERIALQEQVIEAQREALRELSTPLLPLDRNVLALPLVGSIDSSRAQQVMETLLEGIAAHQADMVIVDITGVKVVDTQVAQALVRTAQAVRLLGAQVILTGIQPQIAQTLVHLGADMGGIVTRSTLQSGIAYALQRMEGQNGSKNP